MSGVKGRSGRTPKPLPIETILTMHAGGASLGVIAAHVGVSPHTIGRRLRANGVDPLAVYKARRHG